jgi:UDP:flavonoid glycosyltransferase YjiC (YdhE family)
VAARIAAHQTGAVAFLEKLTVSDLSTLVDEVLNNSMYRDNAHKPQKAIVKTNTDFLEPRIYYSRVANTCRMTPVCLWLADRNARP